MVYNLNFTENGVNVQSVKDSETEANKVIAKHYKWDIVWLNVLGLAYLHVAALYGFYLLLTSTMFATFLWAAFLSFFIGIGTTAGAHRLWSHRCYKAKWPLRLMLAFCHTLAAQNHLRDWVRDHRVHHKFTDTDADPHNSKRGFFFSHMGWLMVRKHPDVKKKGETIDMTDLDNDPIIVWQRRLYYVLMPIIGFLLPFIVPIYFWNENVMSAWHVAVIGRYVLILHGTWSVNSIAHIWGTKPFNRFLTSVENGPLAFLTCGEGWHNYHHSFPWDYKAAELGTYSRNFSTAFIDFFAKIGWAYDLKTASPEVIQRRILRTGDGSRLSSRSLNNNNNVKVNDSHIWGWGDTDMPNEDMGFVEVINKKE